MSKSLDQVWQDFPILASTYQDQRLAYLDSAASAQKPQCLMDSYQEFYSKRYANIHRGVYELSEQASLAFEEGRQTVQDFIGAKHAHECIFVRSATEAINLVASSFGELKVLAGDEILITEMEHHANIVPWQMLCTRQNATLKVLPFDDDGDLDLSALDELLGPKTKLFACTHLSNALGTLNPIKDMIKLAHAKGIPVLIDGAQSAPHLPIDVQDLDCDFFVFSGHKLYGPSGLGVLYGKEKWLDAMPPYQGGGDMILNVSFSHTVYNSLPYKFEAGTPPIAEVVALARVIKYLAQFSWAERLAHEQDMMQYATETLSNLPGLKIIANPKTRMAALPFALEGIHPHDVGSILNQGNVAIRTGHFCAMPIMEHYQVPALNRASFGIYTQKIDIDQLLQGLQAVFKIFKR